MLSNSQSVAPSGRLASARAGSTGSASSGLEFCDNLRLEVFPADRLEVLAVTSDRYMAEN